MKLRDRMIPARIITLSARKGLRPHLYWFWRDLWHVCDDLGRFEASPALLRAVLFSAILNRVSERDVQGYLQALHVAGLIKLYTVKELGYGKVIGFEQAGLRQKKEEYPDETAPDSPDLFSAPGLSAPDWPDPAERKKEERKNQSSAAAFAAPERETFSASPNPRSPRTQSFDTPASASSAPDLRSSISDPRSPAAEPPDDIRADLGYRTRAQVDEPLFLALCRAEGTDPAKLTASGKRSITTALNQIRRACPGLTVEEIERAALAYAKRFPTADRTAFALAKHWARLETRAVEHRPLVEPEPEYWRELVNEEFPESPYARDRDREGTAWEDLPAHVRRHLLASLPPWLAKTNRTTSHAA
jgi:hypothetical protein